MLKKFTLLNCALAFTLSPFVAEASLVTRDANDQPHFYVQMANQSSHDVTLSFKQVAGDGKIELSPTLADNTPLAANQQSLVYGVTYVPLGESDQFNIIFTGKQSCAFTVAFFAPGDPEITMSGYGCAGGGYSVSEHTLTLYISNINSDQKNQR